MDAWSAGRSGERAPERERSGDEAWYSLFARYGPLALRLARGIVPHADQAEDVVQEAVRGVLERSAAGAAPFASPEHARNYFLRAVHSRALDVLRATRRERVQPLGGAAASEPEDREAEASLEEHEAAALRTERMRRALGRLRPDQREALGLRYLEGRSYREIAERLGVSISTLHSRVEASLEKLRERLRES